MTRLILLLGLLLPGCRSLDSAAKPVTLPPASTITAIEVTPNSGEDRTTSVITSRDQIERFVAFVNSRGNGWSHPWHTFPGGMYDVVAKCGEERVGVFWPSPSHIGGYAGDKDAESKRVRSLSNEDWQELERILGVPSTIAPRP
jgi:hypothetical protein